MREFGVRPDRDLGQNFLIDSNILGVIARAAELEPGDVVLEIGGGLGVLSEHLAERVAHVHVVEIDERLREALTDATAAHAEHHGPLGGRDALDLRSLDPAPSKVVANLPYGIAAGALLRTIEELPRGERWVGDGPAGGRRAARGHARQRQPTARRRCSPSSRARCGAALDPRTVFFPCRTSTRCSSGCSGAARRGAAGTPPRCERS